MDRLSISFVPGQNRYDCWTSVRVQVNGKDLTDLVREFEAGLVQARPEVVPPMEGDHRDPSHVWRVNDIHDIDALGSTLPYCDIVVTDKAAASHARRTGLADRLGTTVLSRLDDLIALL